MGDKISEARQALSGALDEFEGAVEAAAIAEGDDIAAAQERAAAAELEVERRQGIVTKLEKVAEARKATPVIVPEGEERRSVITVGKEEDVYRPDNGRSFYRDLVYRNQDPAAAERLDRHNMQTRNLSSTSTAGGDFQPPNYLGQFYTPALRNQRVVLNALPKVPLVPTGNTITVPSISTGGSVAAQADNASVSSTDPVTATITAYVRTFAGNIDVSRQLLDRAEAGGQSIDTILFRDLTAAYDAALELSVLNGTSGAGSHVGLLQVGGSTTSVTYTAGTATVEGTYAKIVSAIASVHTNRHLPPDAIIMHPRRAAWLIGNLTSGAGYPLFQQGSMYHAAGTQDLGLVGTLAGIPVYITPAMPTNLGSGTDEDRIIVCRLDDLYFMEGDLQTRVHEGVLSSTNAIRLQAFSYSAFLSQRFNGAGIAVISGTGLNDVL